MKPFLKQPIPTQPGCYLMKDKDSTVLYVGKAKNLQKRVASYWRATDEKTVALVSEISDIEFIITGNEVEALILEAQLIKKYHPHYNIDLKDGQRYAFLKLTKEEYPRLQVARAVKNDGKYFGPFPSGGARTAAMNAANKIFGLCKYRGLKKPCLRYHLGYCRGACAGLISKEEYGEIIKDVERFFNGEYAILIKKIHEQMADASKAEQFEKAKMYRDQLLNLEKLQDQSVSRPKSYDQDVVNYVVMGASMIVQLFHFDKGIISGRKEYTFDLDTLIVQTPQDALGSFLRQYYASHNVPQEIVVPDVLPEQKIIEAFLVHIAGRKVVLTVPTRGLKKKLLAMVKENLTVGLGQGGGQLYELKTALKLDILPKTINCVDISHLGGTEMVGSLVQFHNGASAKGQYRKFIIKHGKGNNDFASMEEVLTRYLERMKEKKETLPDLFVVDGGRGQLNIAIRVFGVHGIDIPLIGLAKRLEEIYVSWAKLPLRLPPKSPALQLLRALRDEAHRFAITFQRKRRRA
ncbi:MAG: excinuclease ABC subunit UvrC [bacterium]|nr:excinuclease ABC subunit UvrC [bacterium]